MRVVAIFFLFFLLFSCTKKKEPEQPAPCAVITSAITWKSDIRRIINVNCNRTECHAAEGEAGISFESYPKIAHLAHNGVLDFRLSLPVHDPLHMPEDVEMDPCDLYVLKQWILNGAPEN